MAALDDLYKEIILDHYRSPRNQGELGHPAHRCEGFNPLCGDEVIVYVALNDGKIDDIKIGGQGCSISQASASEPTSCSHHRNNNQEKQPDRRQHQASDPQRMRHPQHPGDAAGQTAVRLTKALFETIVGTLLALYALGTDAHMNGSGTDAAQAGKM